MGTKPGGREETDEPLRLFRHGVY